MATIYDHLLRPVNAAALKEQQAIVKRGMRSAYAGYHPADGLTPDRLARLLRESIDGYPERYLELAEDMEERDPHYADVLGIRKRQVSGLDITVEAASDDADDQRAADLVRAAVGTDTFADELIDVLDAIGKGFSATEIIWETTANEWMPVRLNWCHPTWFEFDRDDLETLLLRDPAGPQPLAPYKWIIHRAKTKSGLTIRGGLSRLVAWSYMFKSYTAKDWAVFVERFGQPLRIGKWGAGASPEQQDTLARAVASIGADFHAVIPESMMIEFVEAKITGNMELYERRCDWLDRQVSKAVLGQTQTTDATAGGYATAKVHDGVRDDLEKADARQLMATLNRDLARPVVDLNMGPRKRYPKIKIGRPDEVDVESLVKNVATLVPLGLKVGMSTMRDKIGMPDPAPDEECLAPARAAPVDPSAPPAPGETPPVPPLKPAAQSAAAAGTVPVDAIDTGISEILAGDGWVKMVEPMIAGLSDKLAGCSSLDEVRAVLAAHLATMDTGALAETLAKAAFSARLAGRTGDDLGPTK